MNQIFPWMTSGLSLGARGLCFLIHSTSMPLAEVLEREIDPKKYEYLQELMDKNLVTTEVAE